jgi:hypothetical protein
MSRAISVWYERAGGQAVDVEVGNNDLLGTQEASKAFWSLPIHKTLGIVRLSQLGTIDPVWFRGWNELATLEREVAILEEHMDSIPFSEEPKTRWIRNLRLCLDRLKSSAPPDSIPEFMIG